MTLSLFVFFVLCGSLLGIAQMKAKYRSKKEKTTKTHPDFTTLRKFDTKKISHGYGHDFEINKIHPFDILRIHYCILSLQEDKKNNNKYKKNKTPIALPTGISKSKYTHISYQGKDIWAVFSLGFETERVLVLLDENEMGGEYRIEDNSFYVFYKSEEFGIASLLLGVPFIDINKPIMRLIIDFNKEEFRYSEKIF